MHFPAGEEATAYSVGDFILCHRDSFVNDCIRLGQKLRFRGEDAKYAYWSHAALITSTEGHLAEALFSGVKKTHISRYANRQYTLVRTHVSEADQAQILSFVEQTVGHAYGYTSDFSLLIRCITGTQFSFGFNDQDICSGYVARAQERAGAYFACFAENVMPADLAKHYDVVPPLP